MTRGHPTPVELQLALRRAKKAMRTLRPRTIIRTIIDLQKTVERCPAFFPALLLLGDALEVADIDRALELAKGYLENAVAISGRSAEAVVELGHYINAIENDTLRAEPLFREGAAGALAILENAWLGLINSLREQDRFREAITVGRRSVQVLPESVRLAEALQFAEACRGRGPVASTRRRANR